MSARATTPLRSLLAAVVLSFAFWPTAALALDLPLVQRKAAEIGPQAVASVQQLMQLLHDIAGVDETTRVRRVNDFYNHRIVFGEDSAVWGQNDFWASPLETMERGRGDCEDFAIAKYFSLMAAGVPAHSLRLVYVLALQGGASLPHLVLAYYATPQAEPLILDNLVADVRLASDRPDLRPVFSFNAEGLWQGTGATSAGDPLARLSRWRQVLHRARAEGFL